MVTQLRNRGNPTQEIVMVIVAHRDDETLGMGGTIAKHVEQGDVVFCISMTDGVGARGVGLEARAIRDAAAIAAGKILGLSWLESESFPDNGMDTVPLLEVINAIEEKKRLVKPTIVYTHSSTDLNVDHKIVSQATLTAFRPQPSEIYKEIRTFEVVSSTDYSYQTKCNAFCPNIYIDIKSTWTKKLAALMEYRTEMRAVPHVRSFEGLETLAKYRGNQVGLCYAEAFELIRKIDR